MTGNTLSDLPEELLRNILSFLPPETLAVVELTSSRFRTLANDPLLWRQRCNAEFSYWEDESSPFHKVGSLVLKVDHVLTVLSNRHCKDSSKYQQTMMTSGKERMFGDSNEFALWKTV